MRHSAETVGALYVVASAALWGIFPIVAQQWAHTIPPLFFSGILSILAAVGIVPLMVYRQKTHELKNQRAYVPLLMISVFIVVIPNILFFIGASRTSGLNASVLMLSEILFTLIATPFFGEKNTGEKYMGALGILLGASLVLYKGGHIALNAGDLLIIFSTASFPIGNFYSKKALFMVSPSVVIMARYSIGGIILCMLSALFEHEISVPALLREHWVMFLLVGIGLLPVCKITFYEGMKRLDISKSITLVMTYPFFSLLVLVFFYGEHVALHQFIGVAVMIAGTFFAVKRKSVESLATKYHPK